MKSGSMVLEQTELNKYYVSNYNLKWNALNCLINKNYCKVYIKNTTC